MKLLDFLRPRPQPKPMDLDNFEKARSRLHETVKATARELDAFGDMVLDMRGVKPATQKRRRKSG